MFYQCNDCKFGTNSPKNAAIHQEDEGHTLEEEQD